MANEQLGSVHGSIIIDYDDRGVAHTRLTIRQVRDDVEDLDDTLNRSTRNQRSNSDAIDGSLSKLRKSLRSAHGDMDKLSSGASGMFIRMASSIGTAVLAMGGFAIGGQLIAGLAGAVVALLGVLAIVPGAILAIGLAAATIKLAKKGFEDFKKELQDLKPAFEDLQNAVGKALFKDLADQVRVLAKDYIPLLKTGFVSLAQSLNQVAKNALEFFRSAQTKSDLMAVFDASRIVVDNLGRAFVNLLPAFRDIGTVGAQVFASLTGGAGDTATSFSEMIARFRESGQLEEFMRGGIQALKDLGAILKNVFSIFSQIFGSIQGEGGGFLATLRDLTQAVVDWMHSVEGAKAIYELGQILADVGAIIKDVFLAVLKQLGPIIIALAPGLKDLAQQFRDQILPAIEKLGPMIYNLAKFFSDNSEAIGPLLVAFAAFVGALKLATIAMGIFNAVMALNPFVLIAAAIIALIILVIVYWDDIVAFLVKTWNWIKDLAASVWNSIVDFFKNLFNDIKGFFVGVWNDISDTLESLWQGIVDIATGVFDAIVYYFTNLWAAIKQEATAAWNAISDFFSDIFNAIKNTVSSVFGSIKEFFVNAWTSIVETLKPILDPLIDIVKGVFEIIYTIIKTVVELVWIVIQAAWNGIVFLFHSIFDPLVELWNTVWNAISTTVVNVWNYVSQWFQGKLLEFQYAWHAIIDPLVEWWNGFWQGIQDKVTQIWDYVSQWFASKVQQFSDAWHGVVDPIVEWWNGFWGGIQSTIVDIWQYVVQWFDGKINEMAYLWHSAVDPIVDWWNGIWNSISTTVSNGVSDVINFVSSLPGKIWDALSGAADWLFETGRNLIIGFLNGVKNMVGQAVQQVKDFCNDIIAGAKSLLGIHSPSLVFRAFGEFTMLGYQEGIESLRKKVVGTMSGIATNIVVAGQLPKANVTPGVMTSTLASATNSIRNSTQTTTIGQLTLQVSGNLDPTNPVMFREGIKGIRDGIRNLEGEYAGS